MTLEARARVQQHVRKLQSSAGGSAAHALRPEPAPHFQTPAQPLPTTAPGADNPLDDSQIRDGLDHS